MNQKTPFLPCPVCGREPECDGPTQFRISGSYSWQTIILCDNDTPLEHHIRVSATMKGAESSRGNARKLWKEGVEEALSRR